MKKIKKTAALLTALLLCGSLFTAVACGEKNGEPTNSSSPSESVSDSLTDSSEEDSVSDSSDSDSDSTTDSSDSDSISDSSDSDSIPDSSDSDSIPDSSDGDSSSDDPDDNLPESSVFQLEEHTWTAWETVTEKTCTTDGEEKLVCTDEGCGAVKTRTVKAGHVWSNWTGSTNNLCTQDAQLSRICAQCSDVETQTIKTRGHAYDDGYCKICEEPFLYPTLDEDPTYVDVWDTSIDGSGGAFDRKSLKAHTYYTVDVPATEPESEDYGVWISVPVDGPGQYALLTVGGANGATIERFDASDYYIPGGENGYIGFSALEYGNGEVYSIANCGEMYWNPQWRATWRFSAETDTTVKFVIIQIAPPEWSPSYIHETAIPQQINKVTANEAPEGYTAVTVDYNDDYYYDEWNGVYRRGTKSNPGEVIYVAINSAATRLFGEKTFTTIQEDGNNLSLPLGKDEQGNYLLRDYDAFLMTSKAVDGNAYQNFVNSDGLYPVTKELQEFLCLYMQKNRPISIPDSIWDSENDREQKAWLAPCYYYRPLKLGSEEHPYTITQLGDFEATLAKYEIAYFNVRYVDETGVPVSQLTLSCDDENLRISVNGEVYVGPFSVTIDLDELTGATFYIGAKNNAASTFTLTLSLAEADVETDAETDSGNDSSAEN